MTTQSVFQQLAAVDRDTGTDAQKAVLDQAKAQVGFIPNMYANMVNAPAVLSTYLHGYALFRAESGLSAAEQEVAFLAISVANECSYCLAAHSMIADRVSGVPKDTLAEIREGRPVSDARLRALHRLATDIVVTRGHPGAEALNSFREQGYTEHQVLYLVLAAAVKTLSNYSNHLFATPVDERFAAYAV